MIEGIIYRYISPSGKSYIGQTIDEKSRRQHWFKPTYSYAGPKIDRARAKYGRDNFVYEVLFRQTYEDVKVAKQELNILEQKYVKQYDSFHNGYNCDSGGYSKAGFIVSQDTIEKIRAKHKGSKRSIQACINISKAKLAQHLKASEETRRKMSTAKKGKKFTEEHRKNLRRALNKRDLSYLPEVRRKSAKHIVQYSLTGELIMEYPNIHEASKATGIKEFTIYKCTSGKNKTSGGFIWVRKLN